MGLEVVVDVPEITIATVEAVIRRFRQAGEASWRAPEPISEDALLRCVQFVCEKNEQCA